MEQSNPFIQMFQDPERVAAFADGPPRFTPGFFDLHRLVSILITERVGEHAHILVHGAGGGLEIASMAHMQPHWRFTGVDPALPMLDAAKDRLVEHIERVELCHGFIDAAPRGPYQAATSLLTLHFLDRDDRIATLAQIIDRLEPGAPLVVAHSSFPQEEPERSLWLARYAAFAVSSGVDSAMAQNAQAAVAVQTTLFSAEEELEILKTAGLKGVTQFYQAFTWRGWVGYAA